MSIKKVQIRAEAEDHGKRLDQVLAARLPERYGSPISKSQTRKLIVAGAVYLNRRRVRIASKPLRKGAKIEIYIDSSKIDRPAETRWTPKREDILFEDEDLIAVNKPSGIPSQPTLDEARDNLYAGIKRFLNGAYVGLHHRLDRDTSGIVLFTKAKRANAGIGQLFKEHRIQKTYQTIVWRPKSWTRVDRWAIKNYLGVKTSSGKKKKFGAVTSGGQLARTDFFLQSENEKNLFLASRPQTGRTHQIRVHCFENQMPILGDSLYTDAETIKKNSKVSVPRLMLHASRLTFLHPIRDTEIEVSAPLPRDFQKCLEKLKLDQGSFEEP